MRKKVTVPSVIGKLFPTESKENRCFFKASEAQVFGKVPDGKVFVFMLFYYDV